MSPTSLSVPAFEPRRETVSIWDETGIGVLPLPMPNERFAGASRDDVVLESGFELRPAAPDDRDRHARYRWLLGHHVALCVWRPIIDALDAVADGGRADESDRAAWWFDRYSAAILYAGSCGEPVYTRTIRPMMFAAHPAFSGTWARDYERIGDLLARIAVPADSPLKASIRRSRLVHMAVGKILVPSGGSLFKQNGRRATEQATEVERRLFDAFFLVRRTPVTREMFMAQVARRVDAVLTDLASSPVDRPEYEETLRLLPADLPTMVGAIPLAL